MVQWFGNFSGTPFFADHFLRFFFSSVFPPPPPLPPAANVFVGGRTDPLALWNPSTAPSSKEQPGARTKTEESPSIIKGGAFTPLPQTGAP
ncbi:hypothetical protein BSKO_08216 [Bryopsis sp. KO-2023]|nr:hypothetical protein BSKO_08216 [Bryopsis sp. KO-2023]